MKTIEVLVLPNGETKIEAHGYTGPECMMATNNLSTALGLQTKDTPKPELYQYTTTQQVQANN